MRIKMLEMIGAAIRRLCQAARMAWWKSRADDTAAIRKAIDAADGRTIYLPAGTWQIADNTCYNAGQHGILVEDGHNRVTNDNIRVYTN